tara:strand:+ start:1305 stop:1850 length:546 start_codon:yes stop_codon:yes gene_type:complete
MSKKLTNKQLKAMFAKLGGYDGIKMGDNILGTGERGYVSTSLSTVKDMNIIVGSTPEQLKKMLLDEFINYLKKHNQTVTIKSDKHGKVNFINRKEYDTNEPEFSRYYTTSLRIVGDNIDEEYNVKKHKNPLFSDNPECPQCYKKKTTLYSTTNLQGKKVKVCSSCKENIKFAKEFNKNYKQ